MVVTKFPHTNYTVGLHGQPTAIIYGNSITHCLMEMWVSRYTYTARFMVEFKPHKRQGTTPSPLPIPIPL
jgi:hypothetical protein